MSGKDVTGVDVAVGCFAGLLILSLRVVMAYCAWVVFCAVWPAVPEWWHRPMIAGGVYVVARDVASFINKASEESEKASAGPKPAV